MLCLGRMASINYEVSMGPGGFVQWGEMQVSKRCASRLCLSCPIWGEGVPQGKEDSSSRVQVKLPTGDCGHNEPSTHELRVN